MKLIFDLDIASLPLNINRVYEFINPNENRNQNINNLYR
jgi:hypothetical protein